MPINHLKIDKQFIRNILEHNFEEVVVKAIIDIAHSVDLVVIAEGVETVEQLSAIIRYNCDIVQGYLYSRPVPSKQVEDLFNQVFVI